MRIGNHALAALSIGLLAAGATAQHHGEAAGRTKSAPAKQDEVTAARTPTGATSGSSLVGRVVESGEGEVLGTVRDLLIDGHGRLRAALVDDSSGELRGVPMGRLRTSPTRIVPQGETAPTGVAGPLVLADDDGKLLPTAPSTDAVDSVDASWLALVDAHFGAVPPAVKAMPGASDDGTDPSTDVLSARKLLDFDLRNMEDETLGAVEDIALDLEELKVRYAVIRVASHGEEEGGLHAVPFDARRTSRRQAVLRVDMDRQSLSRSPEIGMVGESLEIQG